MRLTWEDWCWLTDQQMAIRHADPAHVEEELRTGAKGDAYVLSIPGLNPKLTESKSESSLYNVLVEFLGSTTTLGRVNQIKKLHYASNEEFWADVTLLRTTVEIWMPAMAAYQEKARTETLAAGAKPPALSDAEKYNISFFLTELFNLMLDEALRYCTTFSRNTHEYLLIANTTSYAVDCDIYPIGKAAERRGMPLFRVSLTKEEQSDAKLCLTTICGAIYGVRTGVFSQEQRTCIKAKDVYDHVLPFWEKHGTKVLLGAGVAVCVAGLLKYYGVPTTPAEVTGMEYKQ